MTKLNHEKRKGSALKLMLLGCLGVLIGFPATFGLLVLAGLEVTREFVIFALVVCVPATMYYLWTHRSPDNTRFIPD
jgi:hypothetical protein